MKSPVALHEIGLCSQQAMRNCFQTIVGQSRQERLRQLHCADKLVTKRDAEPLKLSLKESLIEPRVVSDQHETANECPEAR